MAYMGVPLLLTYLLVCFSEPFDRLRKPDGLSWWRSRFWVFSRSILGKWRAAHVRWRFGFRARHTDVVDHAVVVGHGQATSRLIRSHFIVLGMSCRSGGVPSTLNGKEREILARPFCLPRLARPSPTAIPFPLSRSRERFLFRSFACSSSSVAPFLFLP